MTSAISTGRKHGYSSLQIAFHWTTVGLVAFQWFLGQIMSRAYWSRAEMGAAEATSLGGAYVHIALGTTILILMLAAPVILHFWNARLDFVLLNPLGMPR